MDQHQDYGNIEGSLNNPQLELLKNPVRYHPVYSLLSRLMKAILLNHYASLDRMLFEPRYQLNFLCLPYSLSLHEKNWSNYNYE